MYYGLLVTHMLTEKAAILLAVELPPNCTATGGAGEARGVVGLPGGWGLGGSDM